MLNNNKTKTMVTQGPLPIFMPTLFNMLIIIAIVLLVLLQLFGAIEIN